VSSPKAIPLPGIFSLSLNPSPGREGLKELNVRYIQLEGVIKVKIL
jgi:hypothetical protein